MISWETRPSRRLKGTLRGKCCNIWILCSWINLYLGRLGRKPSYPWEQLSCTYLFPGRVLVRRCVYRPPVVISNLQYTNEEAGIRLLSTPRRRTAGVCRRGRIRQGYSLMRMTRQLTPSCWMHTSQRGLWTLWLEAAIIGARGKMLYKMTSQCWNHDV